MAYENFSGFDLWYEVNKMQNLFWSMMFQQYVLEKPIYFVTPFGKETNSFIEFGHMTFDEFIANKTNRSIVGYSTIGYPIKSIVDNRIWPKTVLATFNGVKKQYSEEDFIYDVTRNFDADKWAAYKDYLNRNSSNTTSVFGVSVGWDDISRNTNNIAIATQAAAVVATGAVIVDVAGAAAVAEETGSLAGVNLGVSSGATISEATLASNAAINTAYLDDAIASVGAVEGAGFLETISNIPVVGSVASGIVGNTIDRIVDLPNQIVSNLFGRKDPSAVVQSGVDATENKKDMSYYLLIIFIPVLIFMFLIFGLPKFLKEK